MLKLEDIGVGDLLECLEDIYVFDPSGPELFSTTVIFEQGDVVWVSGRSGDGEIFINEALTKEPGLLYTESLNINFEGKYRKLTREEIEEYING